MMSFNYGGYQQQFQPFGQQYGQQNSFGQKSNIDWIMVATVADVDRVQVQPGTKSWVMVQNEPIFALRTADQMGLVQTDIYRFEKYQAPEAVASGNDWVTKEQMTQAIAAAIAGLKEALHESTDRQNADQ